MTPCPKTTRRRPSRTRRHADHTYGPERKGRERAGADRRKIEKNGDHSQTCGKKRRRVRGRCLGLLTKGTRTKSERHDGRRHQSRIVRQDGQDPSNTREMERKSEKGKSGPDKTTMGTAIVLCYMLTIHNLVLPKPPTPPRPRSQQLITSRRHNRSAIQLAHLQNEALRRQQDRRAIWRAHRGTTARANPGPARRNQSSSASGQVGTQGST